MKTFKMISIKVLDEDKLIDFPLNDGIIINQENSHRMWILEIFIDEKHRAFFEKRIASEELFEAKVVISYPENEPAAFNVTASGLKKIGDNISVLMKGRLKRARTKYAEQLLEELISDGLEGANLLEKFETDMRERPRLKKDSLEE